MKLKEFEIVLKKGLGRCFTVLEEDANKYKGIVDKYCTKCLAIDPFIEGTRSGYMYKIFSFFDKKYFLQKILYCFNKENINNKNDFQYYVEILNMFADEGFEEANTALWDKYNYLYEKLLNKKNKPKGKFTELECFEIIALSLSYTMPNFILVIKNIAELLRNIKIYSCKNFSWFFEMKEEFIEELSNYENDSLIKFFLNIYLQYQYQLFEQVKNPEQEQRTLNDDLAMFSIYLSKQDETTIKEYAYKYVAAKSDEEKIKYLKCFEHCEFPLLPDLIIEDSKSENLELSEIAYKVLSLFKNNQVREFALTELKKRNFQAYSLFLKNYNYSEDDENTLKDLIINATDEEIKVVDNNIGLLIDIFDFGKLNTKPQDILIVIYNKTYSSWTRTMILDLMLEYNCIPQEILDECINDCNVETRMKVYQLRENGGFDE